MSTGITVKEAMVNRVVTIRPTQTVAEAAKMMKKEDVGMLVIIEGRKPLGIITREDIINKIVASDKHASDVKIKEIMSSSVITSSPDEDMADAARKMSRYGYERLPVVDMGKLVGVISDREIAKVAPAAIEILRERLLIDEPEDASEEVAEEKRTVSGDCELCYNYSETLHKVNGKWVCEACKEEAAEL